MNSRRPKWTPRTGQKTPELTSTQPEFPLRARQGDGPFPASRLLCFAELQQVFHVLQPLLERNELFVKRS